MAIPIWKDKIVSLGTGSSAEYTIRRNNFILYSGRAYKRPGDTTIKVRVNDICADFLENVLPDMSFEVSPSGSVETFNICDSVGNVIQAVTFVNDWSYEERSGDTILSEPIDGRVSSLQTLLFSRIGDTDEVATIRYKSGNTSNVTLDASEQGTQAGTGVLDLRGFSGLESVTWRGITYQVVDDCTRFVLVYANAIGGWDTLLQGGNVSETDRYTRHEALLEERGRKNYVNEVEKTMDFNTGWLTDEQSARMHHLLGSTNVYLYDMMQDTYHPVVITNADCPYKRFKEGRSLVSYTINLSYAENRTRR